MFEDEESPLKSVKMLFLGQTGVGKTCIYTRMLKNEVLENPIATAGFGLGTMVIENNSGEKIRVDLWDTAGQEKYRSLTPTYFTNASIAFLVYDITELNTLKELESFIELLGKAGPPECQMILVGNKIDMGDSRQIDYDTGEKFRDEHNIKFLIETSAITGSGIEELMSVAINMPSILMHNIEKTFDVSEFPVESKHKKENSCC